MVEEISQRRNYLQKEGVQTLYFGGGTPSLLTAEELRLLLDEIHKNYSFTPDFEFTLEANPDDINPTSLKNWKELGVNRLSIGIQSFFQEDLDWMNRAHTAEESEKALKLAKEAGFLLTADLIYGLPNRSLEDWKTNIQKLVALNPEHISAYCLTVEKRTALYKMITTGKLPRVEEDMQADQFELLVQELAKAGYEQYEISNFAKEGKYAVHNSNYWLGVPYLGIGPSAHSFDGKSRQWNVANNQTYMKEVLTSGTYFEKEELTPQDQFNESLLIGLRTKWGVQLSKLTSFLPLSEEFQAQKEVFLQEGLLKMEEDTLILTPKGILQADYVASQLFVE